jgi:hypothetical protein
VNVKPIHVVLALLALAAVALLFNWSLHHWTKHELALEMVAEPPLAIYKSEKIEGKLRSMPKDTGLTLDGQAEPLAGGEADQLQVPLADAGPGLHVARLDVGSRTTTKDGVRLWERSIELGVMKGPFEAPDQWHPCAVELHLRQSLLDDFLSPELVSQLSSLHELPITPAIASATATFKWAGDGIDAAVHLGFVTGTDLDIRGHLRISVNTQHELRLERLNNLEISGRQVAAWHGRLDARIAVALNAILGGLSGEGFASGAQHGLASIDAEIRSKITTLVDERLLKVDQLVRLPGAFPYEGVSFHYRYCRAVDIVAGRSGTIGFDVEEEVSQHELAATFQLAEMPPSPVPALPESAGNIAVDFSPGLLNGLLDAAWRSGRLAQLMNEPRWLDRINANHSDIQLDFKVRSVEPLLPPVLEVAESGAELRLAETRLNLTVKGRTQEQDARLFASIHVHPRFAGARDEFGLDVALTDLAATCHDPESGTGKVLLTPCYAELLQTIDEQHLETPEDSPLQLGPSLRHLLQALPFKLSHIHPSVVPSGGQPWFRVTADMAPQLPSH